MTSTWCVILFKRLFPFILEIYLPIFNQPFFVEGLLNEKVYGKGLVTSLKGDKAPKGDKPQLDRSLPSRAHFLVTSQVWPKVTCFRRQCVRDAKWGTADMGVSHQRFSVTLLYLRFAPFQHTLHLLWRPKKPGWVKRGYFLSSIDLAYRGKIFFTFNTDFTFIWPSWAFN